MNEDYTNNETINENSSLAEPVVSEPYRYKYENGEKKESTSTSDSSYYHSVYDTYNYNTTTSAVTGEVPPKKKKHPFLKAVKWLAGAACFGIIAGAAFIGTSSWFRYSPMVVPLTSP